MRAWQRRVRRAASVAGARPSRRFTADLGAVRGSPHTGGQPLSDALRVPMEAKLGHDFSRVRVHTGAAAAASARAAGAAAYTVGDDIVFGKGRYAPGSREGRRLLAHELAHVVQQRGGSNGGVGGVGRRESANGHRDVFEAEAEHAGTVALRPAHAASGRHPTLSAAPRGLVQRQEEVSDEEASRWLRLGREPLFRLHLDPDLEAQMRAFEITRQLLSPDLVRSALFDLDYDAIFGAPPPSWLTAPAVPSPEPLVPPGRGPSTPRAAKPGDVATAILRIPAVDSALTTLRTDAASRARREWNSLATGERVLVVSHVALVSAGALAGVIADPETRSFALGLLQDRTLPVPGVPGLSFQFNLTGPEQRVRFDLNLGALLPAAWGFR